MRAPAIEILFPTTSVTTEYCARFTVVAQVSDFSLAADDQTTGGHWLLWDGPDCDLELVGRSSNAFLELPDALAPGTHVLYAELVDASDQPLDPPIRYRTSIRVAESNEACVGGDAGWGGTDTGGE